MEGDGQADLLRAIRELFDHGSKSRGGDGDVSGADIHAPRSGDDIERLVEVFVVGEGFAHAHEDDVVDLFPRNGFDGEQLGYDLVCAEVAGESVESGGAEFAGVGATDLRGNAGGVAVRFVAVEGGGGRDEDGFYIAAVVEFEEKLSGGVFRSLDADGL